MYVKELICVMLLPLLLVDALVNLDQSVPGFYRIIHLQDVCSKSGLVSLQHMNNLVTNLVDFVP